MSGPTEHAAAPDTSTSPRHVPRRRVAVLLVVLLCAALVPAIAGPATAAPGQPAPSYANPVSGGLTANPSILKAADGSYYAYVNGFDYYAKFPVMALRSTDLATWTQVGNVLPTATAGAWTDTATGRNFTSPSVLHLPSNLAASRYVMYFTAKKAGSNDRCIGVATASDPAGPFTGAATPLICPPGGAQDPGALPAPANVPFQQLAYKHNGTNPGIYNQVLSADGLTIHPDIQQPWFLYAAHPTWWHNGTVERPTLASDGTNAYLFFAGGTPNTGGRAIGWTPCTAAYGIATSCTKQTHLGTFIAGTSSVSSPSGPHVFSDGTHQWLAYDGLPGGSCTGTTCTGTRSMRIDKLCYAHAQPRTNAPSTGPQTLTRTTNCSTDIPGAPLTVSSITDNTPLSQPATIPFRDGGATTSLNGRVLWMFSDGFGIGGCSFLSNSAALGVPAAGATGPNWSTQPTDANGCVSQFIPFTSDELSYNEQHRTVDGKRYALWEQAGIPLPNGDALAFFLKLIHDSDIDGAGPDTGCGICYEFVGNGAVRVPAGSTVANRSTSVSPVACNPTCLFSTTDGAYGRPFIDNGHVYAYNDYKLGRAPVGSVENRSAWQFWNDTPGWGAVADADEVPGLHDLPDAWNIDGGVGQVSYNPYLDKYVNLVPDHAFAFNQVVIQTAPAPEGPWTPEQPLYDTNAHSCGQDYTPYGSLQSPELVGDGGRTIPFVYARPGPAFGTDPNCPGQVRQVQLRLG